MQATSSLKRINFLLDKIETADRAKFCSADFCAAVRQIESRKFLFSNGLSYEIEVLKSRLRKEQRRRIKSVSEFLKISSDNIPHCILLNVVYAGNNFTGNSE